MGVGNAVEGSFDAVVVQTTVGWTVAVGVGWWAGGGAGRVVGNPAAAEGGGGEAVRIRGPAGWKKAEKTQKN